MTKQSDMIDLWQHIAAQTNPSMRKAYYTLSKSSMTTIT